MNDHVPPKLGLVMLGDSIWFPNMTKLCGCRVQTVWPPPAIKWYIQGFGSCALTKRSPCSSLLATCRVLVITSISSSLESIENIEDIEMPRNKAGIQIWYPKTSQNHWFPQLRMTKNPDDLVSWLRKPPTETRAFRFQRHQSAQNLPQS